MACCKQIPQKVFQVLKLFLFSIHFDSMLVGCLFKMQVISMTIKQAIEPTTVSARN